MNSQIQMCLIFTVAAVACGRAAGQPVVADPVAAAAVEATALAGAPDSPDRPDIPSRAPRMDAARGDSERNQTMLLRLLEHPEAAERIGIDEAVLASLIAEFGPIDQQVEARRRELAALQGVQARLIVDGAEEARVMAAIDDVWRVRAEIAKLQTSKFLKVRGLLTEDQINRLDEVRQTLFRERRMRQLEDESTARPPREGRGARGPARPNRERQDNSRVESQD